jgi:hypothetical protein
MVDGRQLTTRSQSAGVVVRKRAGVEPSDEVSFKLEILCELGFLSGTGESQG